MKAKEFINIGFKQGPIIGSLLVADLSAKKEGISSMDRKAKVRGIQSDPQLHLDDVHFGSAAKLWYDIIHPEETYKFSSEGKPLHIWGEEHIEEQAIDQMKRAMEIPPAVQGALCADAHFGYGIPIGGVLALDNAVSPFSVGVDIACRMMLSVIPLEVDEIDKREDDFRQAIEKNTRFGLGAAFQGNSRRDAHVMDMDWSITNGIVDKDTAWNQLGSSGGGNHFIDIGEIEFLEEFDGTHSYLGQIIPAGKYVAILTHSGSRGMGSKIANHFTRVAMAKHPLLPPQFKRLAWLSLDDEDGAAYWQAMTLAGHYASANHHCIHSTVLRELGMEPLTQVENHHNFAWQEVHDDRKVIVHRKGATPAGKGVLGIIPGSMATPGFLVRGKGVAASLNSAAHGAGRAMSRKAAKEKYRWASVKDELKHKRVKLISGGIDEVPGAYKRIEEVMAAQDDLVEVVAKFQPRLVKMADDGYVED
jgi:tRNA-splicing ligase RtcB